MLQLKKRRSGSKSVCGFSIILISKGIWSQRVNVSFVFWNPIRTFRELNLIRSSLLQVFGKKGVLRNCAKFTVKHLPQSLFFKQSCRPEVCNFIKKETSTGVFLWFLRNFKEHLFLQNTSGDWFNVMLQSYGSAHIRIANHK